MTKTQANRMWFGFLHNKFQGILTLKPYWSPDQIEKAETCNDVIFGPFPAPTFTEAEQKLRKAAQALGYTRLGDVVQK